MQDIIKPGIQERFERLRKMGVKTVMVTGDNPLTANILQKKQEWMTLLQKPNRKTKWNISKRAGWRKTGCYDGGWYQRCAGIGSG